MDLVEQSSVMFLITTCTSETMVNHHGSLSSVAASRCKVSGDGMDAESLKQEAAGHEAEEQLIKTARHGHAAWHWQSYLIGGDKDD